MKNYDTIVAGAGIWGCTIARRLAESGKKVLVLEKRPSVGGNVRCEIDPETGIEVHTYGSHIFHTHIPDVWEFVNRFVKFNGYQHKVLACSRMGRSGKLELEKGRIYHLPMGLTLINKFFDIELKPGEVEAFMKDEAHAQAIFDAFFRGYTSKQWGKSPEDIDPAIIKRVPVRHNYDTNYFNDYWQGIPAEGYNVLFDRLLDHPNIVVETEMTVRMGGDNLQAARNQDSTRPPLEVDLTDKAVYYSGPIDELFNYQFGALPWRTLRFERETLDVSDYQGTSVVNYPDIDVPYTRIHEFKHYHPEARGKVERVDGGGARPVWGFDASKTIVMKEFSATWQLGDEPYYPINNAESTGRLSKYQDEVDRLNSTATASPRLIVGGRLGQYKYFDMDSSIAAALKVELK